MESKEIENKRCVGTGGPRKRKIEPSRFQKNIAKITKRNENTKTCKKKAENANTNKKLASELLAEGNAAMNHQCPKLEVIINLHVVIDNTDSCNPDALASPCFVHASICPFALATCHCQLKKLEPAWPLESEHVQTCTPRRRFAKVFSHTEVEAQVYFLNCLE